MPIRKSDLPSSFRCGSRRNAPIGRWAGLWQAVWSSGSSRSSRPRRLPNVRGCSPGWVVITLQPHGSLGFRPGRNRWRFVLNHAGLWLALFAGVVGSADEQTVRIPVFRDKPNNEAFTEEGAKIYLSKELQLNDFTVEHYSNGVPRHFFAEISIDGKPARLEVNHPYAANWADDYYLTSYDVQSEQPQYCVVQIVRQPLKYVMWIGIIMMLCGGCLLFVSGPNGQNKELSETSR